MYHRQLSFVRLLTLLVLLGLLLLAGCRAFQPEAVIVNKEPETYIIGSPLEHAGGYYRFHVFWYGADQDGQVERFVWALTDTTIQNLDTTDDEEDSRFNPALDATHLDIAHWTVKTDSIFNFEIDQGTSPSIDMTLHMVAIDDFGDYDRTPARLHFFSNTLGTPSIRFFRINFGDSGADTIPIGPTSSDTVGFGRPYTVYWEGDSPNVRGFTDEALAEVDTVFPYDDGLFGYKWQLTGALGGGCIPTLEDCWHPRRFIEAEGDSESFFDEINSLTFRNDGSSSDPFGQFLESGPVGLRINAKDVAGVEVADYLRQFNFSVNYDPDTILLNGETDWDHPEDTEVYPYYIRFNDPSETKVPFVAGDRIPDRTYVVFKALARDNLKDVKINADFKIGLTGRVNGVRSNFTGGVFGFGSGSSDVDTDPTWDAGLTGWYADTLGFMTGPSTEFTFIMQALDEHGRRDMTPPEISFEVGFPPCVQCVEILPDLSNPSGFLPDEECYDGVSPHACFGDTAEFYINQLSSPQLPERTYLTPMTTRYLAIDRGTMFGKFQDDLPDPDVYYSFPCNVYSVSVLLHGLDDERERWDDPLLRSLGWQYQVDYGCDPYNNIKDGGGFDDITKSTWGYETGETRLTVNPDGTWKVQVDILLPQQLVQMGADLFKVIITNDPNYGAQDPVLGQQLFDICTRQLGGGTVQAIMLDQAQCGLNPLQRPAMYHLFGQVRPPAEVPIRSWRDCSPGVTDIVRSMSLTRSAMASHRNDEAVQQYFRLIFQDTDGTYECDPDLLSR